MNPVKNALCRFLVLGIAALVAPHQDIDGASRPVPPGLRSGWAWQNPFPQGNNMSSVSFVSPTLGWATVQDGLILRTQDGGATWAAQARTASPLRGIRFVNPLTGWAVGDFGPTTR